MIKVDKISVRLLAKICFVIVLIYFLIGPMVDRVVCHNRVSQELGVPSNGIVLWNALNEDLNAKIKTGSTYYQTFSLLEENSGPYKVIWRYADIGGGFKEYVSLETCHFSRNDFTFLFYFSENERLTDIINYVED